MYRNMWTLDQWERARKQVGLDGDPATVEKCLPDIAVNLQCELNVAAEIIPSLVDALKECLAIFGNTPEEQVAYAEHCVTSCDAKFILHAQNAISSVDRAIAALKQRNERT